MRSGTKKCRHPHNRVPPLQIGYMISLLKKEHEIDFFDGWIRPYPLKLLLKRTVKFNPSVIIISVSAAPDRQHTLAYAAKIKEILPYLKIICIGPYASIQPESLIFEGSPIDFVLRGECELDIVTLLNNLNLNSSLTGIKSLYSKEKTRAEIALIEDLDSLPAPQHPLFKPENYFSIYPLKLNLKLKWGYILSSRGCSHQCIFCSPLTRNSYGPKTEYRSVKNIIEEMLYLKSLGRNIISFEDDSFLTHKEHALELCGELINKKLAIPWIAHARITDLSKDLMVTMRKAGCILLKVGIESNSNRIIDILGKTGEKIDWDKKTRQVFIESQEANLPLHAMFIIGNPEETESDLALTINLIKNTKVNSIQVHYFMPYPGSKAFDTYCSKQKLNDQLHHYNSSEIINLSRISTEKLKRMRNYIYRTFYLNPAFIIRHILTHWRFYIRNLKVVKEVIKGLI